jgi:hypothetical protein
MLCLSLPLRSAAIALAGCTSDGTVGRRDRSLARAAAARATAACLGLDVEAILMAAIAAVQVLLFALGAAGVRPLGIFNNTEFVMLTLISMTQAVIGVLINARTLRRSIDVT